MRNLVSLFLASLLLFMFQRGWAATCNASAIDISQKATGAKVEGSLEYEVVISNTCECPQAYVLINCLGFVSKEDLDPNVIRRVTEVDCLVNNGNPIYKAPPMKFKYAWDKPYVSWVVVGSTPRC